MIILGQKSLTNKLIRLEGRAGKSFLPPIGLEGRTGKSLLPPNRLIMVPKHQNSFIITDPKGMIFGPQFAEYSRISEKDRKAFLATNNWRKMHGYPLRRGATNKYYKDTYVERRMILVWERIGCKFDTIKLDEPAPYHTIQPDYSKLIGCIHEED